MTKLINPGLMKTSRRNVLRGSVLARTKAAVQSQPPYWCSPPSMPAPPW